MGAHEDRFFATLFLGSGLIFIAMLFSSVAITDSLIESIAGGNISGGTYYFGRHMSDALLNLFAMKMAGVFMFSTCMLGLRTVIFPRWIAYIGYGCGVMLLLIIANWKWIGLVFPAWMLVVSAQMLATEFRHRMQSPTPHNECPRATPIPDAS